MGQLKITQVRSSSRREASQGRTLVALGIREAEVAPQSVAQPGDAPRVAVAHQVLRLEAPRQRLDD